MTKETTDFKKRIKQVDKFVRKNLFYILTGLTVLIVGGVIIFNYNKTKITNRKEISQKERVQKTVEKKESEKNKIHVVKKGEHLWMIAERYYGSGYNAIDIAQANQLKNPNLIFAGQKLVIPTVKPRKPTTGKIANMSTEQRKVKVKEYRVKKGDYLWKIALEVYGDGYAWVKIAKVNKLKNPSLIYPGQKLIIP